LAGKLRHQWAVLELVTLNFDGCVAVKTLGFPQSKKKIEQVIDQNLGQPHASIRPKGASSVIQCTAAASKGKSKLGKESGGDNLFKKRCMQSVPPVQASLLCSGFEDSGPPKRAP